MKLLSKEFGQILLVIAMIFIACITLFEIIITWSTGVWEDYPWFIIGIFGGFAISSIYVARFFRRILAS